MARGPKKVKEYESIKVVKYFAKGEGMKEFEIKKGHIFYAVCIIIILCFLTACNKNIDPTTTIVNQIIKNNYEQSKSND